MFKFTTNTISNSTDYPAFSGVKEDAVRFYVDDTDQNNPILRVAKHHKFESKNIKAAYKRMWSAPQTFQITVPAAALAALNTADTTGRIVLYVKLSGSQNSYYSNDFVFKGKPFYIEFPVKTLDTAATLAPRIAKIANKYQSMVYEYPLISVTADASNNLVVKGTDEYQVVTKFEVQRYVEATEANPNGDFEVITDMTTTGDTALTVLNGKEGFGTYRQIIKDLRVPTAANTRWDRIAVDETPGFGGHYVQYTIVQCVDRGVLGSDAVGQTVQSLTAHVFYVLDTTSSLSVKAGKNTTVAGPAADFEEALISVLSEGVELEEVNKDADDVALTAAQMEASTPAEVATAETAAHVTNVNAFTANE